MRSLRSPAQPAVYYPLAHVYSSAMAIHARGTATPIGAPDLRSAVAEADPELPVMTVADLQASLAGSMSETRAIGYLVAVFAGLALVLAAVGLYGLVSFGAAQRVRELGIRMAIGAEPRSLETLVLKRGLVVSTVGVLAGLVVAYALGQALQGLLFGVEASDSVTLAAAAALLLATAATAAWLPARRASRVDAAVSLRDE